MFVVQIGIFEDDLDQGFACRGLDYGLYLVLDHPVLTRPQPADVDDHVEFGRSIGQSLAGLENLGSGLVGTVRKSDNGSHGNLGTLQEAGGEDDVGGTDAHRSHLISGGQVAALFNIAEGELGTEQRMVDRFGNLAVGDIFRSELLHEEDDGTVYLPVLVTVVPRCGGPTVARRDQETSVTDHPPSTATICPVIIRD